MNASTIPPIDTAQKTDVFSYEARRKFAWQYPEQPHKLTHSLADSPMLELPALAELAEQLPEASVEYNRGDVPIGVDEKPESTGIPIGETIRRVHEANSWAVLKNIEQAPVYEALLMELLSEIRNEIEAKTGEMLRPQGFIFISSPNAVTPFHFDPEHNILLQLQGSKVMTQYPASDTRFVPDEFHEQYHVGGARELAWDDSFLPLGREFSLSAGEALYVPVMAPHFVKNGPESSISLSITWRSHWSFAESEARAFNRQLRRFGLSPKAPGRWPHSNGFKSAAYRALRKLGLG